MQNKPIKIPLKYYDERSGTQSAIGEMHEDARRLSKSNMPGQYHRGVPTSRHYNGMESSKGRLDCEGEEGARDRSASLAIVESTNPDRRVTDR
jgi:hypothetical protein